MRTLIAFVLMALGAAGCAAAPPGGLRPLELEADGRWIGAGISYGEYRDGQGPGGAQPSDDELLEDLRLLSTRWTLIRMYGAQNGERVARLIDRHDLPLRLMLGAWIETESSPEARADNREQVEIAIRAANAYPSAVWALSIGNESQVFWSGHRTDINALIGYIEHARASVSVPVTTCDDYNFWNKPESRAVAAVCDFIGLHAYAMWNKQTLVDAVSWTREQVEAVRAMHPGLPIVHAETGWATQKHTEGEQGELIIADAGEREQELFYRAYVSWATEAKLPHFYFVAFDENWKGGPHPDEVEKHWGLYEEDRTPKLALDPERGAQSE
ncbi:MAG: glycosyl hydrolase family 17 [Planctomycetota bacterium]